MTVSKLTSGYNFIEEYQEIALKYFTGEKLSGMRVGTLGMICEDMGKNTEAILLDSMFRAKEYNVSTAERMSTLLINAANMKMDVANANPATMDMFIGIPTSMILSRGTRLGADYQFTLAKDTIIEVLSHRFLLDYDIKILAKEINTGIYNYSAQYVVGTENQISNIKNPYIISTVRTDSSVEYMMMRVQARQCDKNYAYHTVVENDDINLIGIEFTYNRQLAYFNAFYREQGATAYTQITLQNILSKSRPSTNYLLYDISESGIISISAESAFVPALNSEIRLDIYTTEGSSGNFNYKSGATDVQLASYENYIDYSGLYAVCVPIGNSLYGTDASDKEALRNEIITTRATLNGLNIDNDLNLYFKKLDTVNTMLFVKKRSDIKELRYTGYMIPKDENGYIIPTTTGKLIMADTDFNAYYNQTDRRIIKADTKFTLQNAATDRFTFIKESATLTSAQIATIESDYTKTLLGTPYLIVVNSNPESISYYLNSVKSDHSVRSEYINTDTTNQFVINYFNISRNAVAGEDVYTIKVNVLPNSDISDMVANDGTLLDVSRLALKGVTYDDGSINGYFDFTFDSYNKDEKYFTFKTTLKTNDYLSLENKLLITDSIYAPGTTTLTDTLVYGSDVKIGLCVYKKETVVKGQGSLANVIPGMTDFTLTNTYTNDIDLTNLFIDMTDKIRSILSLPDANTFILNEVPLVKYSSLIDNNDTIANTILVSKSRLDDMNALTTNNFSIDFKFYRTYGGTKYFKTGDSDEDMDHLDLSMEFNAYVRTTAGQGINVNIFENMKAFIKQYVEKINLSTDAETSLFISNITTAVENEYSDYIKSISLKSLNGGTVPPRVISYVRKDFSSMSADEIRAYVPEYVNVAVKNITINILEKK